MRAPQLTAGEPGRTRSRSCRRRSGSTCSTARTAGSRGSGCPPVAYARSPMPTTATATSTSCEAATLDDAAAFFTPTTRRATRCSAWPATSTPTRRCSGRAVFRPDPGPGRAGAARLRRAGACRRARGATSTTRSLPQPALAVGYRVPDPLLTCRIPAVVVLLRGADQRATPAGCERRLVQRDRSVTSVSTYLGTFGDPFDQRDPLLLTLEVYHPAETAAADRAGRRGRGAGAGR